MDEFIKGLYAKIARGGQLPPDFGLSPGDFPRLDEIPLDITGHEATQQARDPRQQRNVVIEDGEVAEEPEYSAPAQASRLPEQRKIYKGKVRVVLPYGIIIRPDDRTYKDVTVEITQISHDLRLFDNDTDGDRIATIKREISEGDAAWVKVIAIKQDDRGEQQALGSMKVVSQTDGEDFDPLGLFLKQEGSTTVAKPELVEPPRRGGNNSIPANGRTANGAAALRVRGANASISTPKGGIKKLPPPKMLQRQPAAQQQARQQFAQQIAQQQARQQQQQQLQQQQVQNKTKSPQNKARPPNSKNEIVDGQPEEGEVYMDTTTVGEVPNSNNNGTARGLGRGKATTVPAWMTSGGGVSNATNSATEGSQIVAAIVEALRAQGPLRTIDQALGALDKLGIRYDIHISSSTTQQTTQQTPKGRRESFEEPNSLPYPSPTGFGVKSGTVKPLPNGPGYVPDLGGDEDDDEVVLDDDEDDAYNVAPKAEIYRAQLPRQNQRQGAQFNPNRSKQPAGRGRRSSDSFKPNFKQNMNNHPNPNLNNKRPFSGPTKNGKRPYFSG